jgi:cytoskeletal protein RodZ
MAHDELKVVGETLRRRREDKNISLKEASNATSIRLVHLEAIEKGEGEKLISPVYAQGFFKQYAAYLGLDADQLVKDNPDLFAKPEGHDFAYGIGTLEMRGHPASHVKWLPNAAWIFAFLAILGIAWLLATYLKII